MKSWLQRKAMCGFHHPAPLLPHSITHFILTSCSLFFPLNFNIYIFGHYYYNRFLFNSVSESGPLLFSVWISRYFWHENPEFACYVIKVIQNRRSHGLAQIRRWFWSSVTQLSFNSSYCLVLLGCCNIIFSVFRAEYMLLHLPCFSNLLQRINSSSSTPI